MIEIEFNICWHEIVFVFVFLLFSIQFKQFGRGRLFVRFFAVSNGCRLLYNLITLCHSPSPTLSVSLFHSVSLSPTLSLSVGHFDSFSSNQYYSQGKRPFRNFLPVNYFHFIRPLDAWFSIVNVLRAEIVDNIFSSTRQEFQIARNISEQKLETIQWRTLIRSLFFFHWFCALHLCIKGNVSPIGPHSQGGTWTSNQVRRTSFFSNLLNNEHSGVLRYKSEQWQTDQARQPSNRKNNIVKSNKHTHTHPATGHTRCRMANWMSKHILSQIKQKFIILLMVIAPSFPCRWLFFRRRAI